MAGSFRRTRVFSLALGLTGFLIIRNRPEDSGFPPVNPPTPSDGSHPASHWMKSLVRVIKAPGIWSGFWVNFGINGGLYAFMGLWGIPFLRGARGMSRTEASGYMTVMLLAYTVGLLFSGWIADHIGRRKPVLIFTAVLSALAWLALLYLPWESGWSGMALFAFLGFAGTGTIVTFATAKESTDPSLAGTAHASPREHRHILATLIVQPLIGWVLDLGWDGTLVNRRARIFGRKLSIMRFLVILAFSAIGIAGALRIRETRGKKCGNCPGSRCDGKLSLRAGEAHTTGFNADQTISPEPPLSLSRMDAASSKRSSRMARVKFLFERRRLMRRNSCLSAA